MGQRNYDVIIIGAGVQGLSAAYHVLAQTRMSVLVLEAHDKIGQGSSGRSGSMLMKSRENQEKIALSNYSYDRFMRFHDEFGVDISFRKTGFLSLVPEQLSARYMAEHQLRVDAGVPSEILTPKDIQSICEGVCVDGVEFGVLGHDDGEIDAQAIMHGYKRNAERLGVTISLNEKAVSILVENDKVVGVATNQQRYGCKWVVNAAGAGAIGIAKWVNIELPIDPIRRSIYFVESPEPAFQRGPMVEDAELEWYYRGVGENRVLLGMGKEQNAEPTDGPNMKFWPEIERATRLRSPALLGASVVGGWSGIRPVTPDILPIIGPVESLSGLIISAGWGGEGIMHSPAGGALVADWISEEQTTKLDMESFLLSRFSKKEKEYEND